MSTGSRMRSKSARFWKLSAAVAAHAVFAAGGTLIMVMISLRIVALNTAEVWPLILMLVGLYTGLSAVLYGRAAVLPEGRMRRRTIYAAELATHAILLVITAAVLGGLIVVGFHLRGHGPIPDDMEPPVSNYLWFVVPMLLVGWSWASFFMAMRTISHPLLLWEGPRRVLRRLKRAP